MSEASELAQRVKARRLAEQVRARRASQGGTRATSAAQRPVAPARPLYGPEDAPGLSGVPLGPSSELHADPLPPNAAGRVGQAARGAFHEAVQGGKEALEASYTGEGVEAMPNTVQHSLGKLNRLGQAAFTPISAPFAAATAGIGQAREELAQPMSQDPSILGRVAGDLLAVPEAPLHWMEQLPEGLEEGAEHLGAPPEVARAVGLGGTVALLGKGPKAAKSAGRAALRTKPVQRAVARHAPAPVAESLLTGMPPLKGAPETAPGIGRPGPTYESRAGITPRRQFRHRAEQLEGEMGRLKPDPNAPQWIAGEEALRGPDALAQRAREVRQQRAEVLPEGESPGPPPLRERRNLGETRPTLDETLAERARTRPEQPVWEPETLEARTPSERQTFTEPRLEQQVRRTLPQERGFDRAQSELEPLGEKYRAFEMAEQAGLEPPARPAPAEPFTPEMQPGGRRARLEARRAEQAQQLPPKELPRAPAQLLPKGHPAQPPFPAGKRGVGRAEPPGRVPPPGAPAAPLAPTSPRGGTGGRLDRYIESFRAQFGEEGNFLSDSLGKTESLRRSYMGKAITQFDEATGRLPFRRRDAAAKNVMEWVERKQPTPPWALEFVESAREAMKQNALNARDAGSFILDKQRGPRQLNPNWDEAWTHRLRPEISQQLLAERIAPEGAATPLLDQIVAMNEGLDKAMLKKSLRQPSDSGRFQSVEGRYAGVERPRVIFEMPRDFFPDDGIQVIRDHINRSSLLFAENKVFGQTKTNPKTGNVTKTGGDLQVALDQIAQKQGFSAAEQARFRAERILRRNPQDQMGEQFKGLNRKLSTFTTGSKLVGSVRNVAQQASQIGNQFIEGGVAPVASGLGKTLKSPRAAVRRGRESGAILPDSFRQSLDLMAEGRGGPMARGTRAATDIGMMPQQALDTFARAVASEGAPVALKGIQKKLGKGGRSAAEARRAMERLDLPADHRAAIEAGKLTPEIQRQFQQRWTAMTNIEGGIIEWPRIAGQGINSPKWNFLRQLKNFQVAQTRFFAESVVKEAMKGNFKPTARWMLASLLVGELVHGSVENVGGRAPARGRPSMEQVIESLGKGDFGPMGRRLGQDVVAGGTPGYGGIILTLAMSEDKIRDVEREATMVMPPNVSDLYEGVKRGTGALARDTGREKAQKATLEVAKRGGVRTPRPEDKETRGDVMSEELGRFLSRIFPQISGSADAIRMRVDDEYRRKELRETRGKVRPGVVPRVRKGRENREKMLKEIGR